MPPLILREHQNYHYLHALECLQTRTSLANAGVQGGGYYLELSKQSDVLQLTLIEE